MISIKIILRDNNGSLRFNVSDQKTKSSISQQEMNSLCDWFTKENFASHVVTCNDQSKIILIKNSILYVEGK